MMIQENPFYIKIESKLKEVNKILQVSYPTNIKSKPIKIIHPFKNDKYIYHWIYTDNTFVGLSSNLINQKHMAFSIIFSNTGKIENECLLYLYKELQDARMVKNFLYSLEKLAIDIL